MAEGYLRHFGGPRLEVFSAGLEAHGLHPLAVQVMREDGVDISNHTSDTIEKYLDMEFDYVITVCDNARERCPLFPARVCRLHQGFSDPAQVSGSDKEVLAAFRQVRDDIKEFVLDFLKNAYQI
jgi:arsenate reductase